MTPQLMHLKQPYFCLDNGDRHSLGLKSYISILLVIRAYDLLKDIM